VTTKKYIEFHQSSDVVYHFPIDLTDETISYTWMLRFIKGAHSVLEIGCSTGFFSKYLVKNGCYVVGVEVNPITALQAREVCHKVIVGDIETLELREQIYESFDVVLLGDILEHLKYPGVLLTYIRKAWLNPDGRVVMSVPNSAHWIFRREVIFGRFPYRGYGLFDRTHLRFFTRASLYELVANTGYQVIKSAISVNHNSHDDITFAIFEPLYRRRLDFRSWMIKIEQWLANLFPTIFAYQFILCIKPKSSDHD
jgi:SAM-dependent methyltransferase